MTTLYHGSNLAVPHPQVDVGRDRLDFGKGFYLTNLKQQAEKWAVAVSREEGGQPTVSVYDLDLDAALADGCRHFCMPAYDKQWLDFIAASRNGQRPWLGYDIIEGGIANDRVVRTVELYLRGDMPLANALRKLQYQQPTHQICLLRQSVVSRYLTYKESYTC